MSDEPHHRFADPAPWVFPATTLPLGGTRGAPILKAHEVSVDSATAPRDAPNPISYLPPIYAHTRHAINLPTLSMRIADAYRPGRLGLSFELFPPKSPVGEDDLFAQLPALLAFQPAYVTCTYGAGGSTRAKTLEIVERVRLRFGCAVASHLTCVGSTVDELRTYLTDAAARGVENIVALRGDPPQGEQSFRPVAGGLCYANELVALIHREFPRLGVAVAGYPETHREAPSPEVDLENLRRKVDAGAHAVLTQLFYDNRDFLRFRQRCQHAGIHVPIIPGILPVTSLAQIRRITSLCGAALPPHLSADLERVQNDPAAQFEVGVDYATRQIQQLLAEGIAGLHLYVLNKSSAAVRVLHSVLPP